MLDNWRSLTSAFFFSPCSMYAKLTSQLRNRSPTSQCLLPHENCPFPLTTSFSTRQRMATYERCGWRHNANGKHNENVQYKYRCMTGLWNFSSSKQKPLQEYDMNLIEAIYVWPLPWQVHCKLDNTRKTYLILFISTQICDTIFFEQLVPITFG